MPKINEKRKGPREKPSSWIIEGHEFLEKRNKSPPGIPIEKSKLLLNKTKTRKPRISRSVNKSQIIHNNRAEIIKPNANIASATTSAVSEKFDQIISGSCTARLTQNVENAGAANSDFEVEGASPPKRAKFSDDPSPVTRALSDIEETTDVADALETHSNDSNDTMLYDLSHISPLADYKDEFIASTSFDENTFLINDEIFEKRLKYLEHSTMNVSDSVSVECAMPCEAILQTDDVAGPSSSSAYDTNEPDTYNEPETYYDPDSYYEPDPYYEADPHYEYLLEREARNNWSSGPHNFGTSDVIDLDGSIYDRMQTNNVALQADNPEMAYDNIDDSVIALSSQNSLRAHRPIPIDNDARMQTNNIALQVDNPEMAYDNIDDSVIALSSQNSLRAHRPLIPIDNDEVIFLSETVTHRDDPREKQSAKKDKPEIKKPVKEVTNNNSVQSGFDPSRQCSICFNDLNTTEVASTICGHIFCMSCIKQSLSYERKCPNCRKRLTGKYSYHQLFL